MTTPVGILVVNGAAFVMANLPIFQLVLAGCALVSSLLLNGLTAFWVLRTIHQHALPLYQEYRLRLIALCVLIVLATSAAAAYFTYVGMANRNRLPDRVAVITSIAALVLPFAVTTIGRRLAGMRGVGAPITTTTRRRASQYHR